MGDVYTGGRPFIMDDTVLRQELRPFTTAVRRWSTRHRQGCRMLTGSVKKTHLKCKRLLTSMSYTTLARRLRVHQGRLGIVKARKKSDRCACCYCYDHSMLPSMKRELEQMTACLCQYCPDYWTGLEDSFLDLEGTDALKRIATHVEDSSKSGRGSEELTAVAAEAFGIAQAEANARLAAMSTEMSLYKLHFWLRDSLNAKLWQDKLEPQKHTIYAWINFAETVDASLSLTPVVGTVIFSLEMTVRVTAP